MDNNHKISKFHFLLYCIGGYVFAISYGASFLIAPIFEQRGSNEAFAGTVISVAAISTLIFVIFSGHIADYLGIVKSLALGGLFLMLSMLGFYSHDDVSHILLIYGLLLGAGWGIYYTLGPIFIAAVIDKQYQMPFFAIHSGSMMTGIGSAPLLGGLLGYFSYPLEYIFVIALIVNMMGVVIYIYLHYKFIKNDRIKPQISRISWQSCYHAVQSKSIFSIIIVGLGGCIFGAISSFQSSYADILGLNETLFFIGFVLSVITGRILLAGYVHRFNPFKALLLLTSMVSASLLLFIFWVDNNIAYLLTSVMLGSGYGLTYSVVNGLAAREAPINFMPQTLLLFSLSYLLGTFGFPVIAGYIIVEYSIIAMMIVLCGISLVNNGIALYRVSYLHDDD